MVAPGLKSHTGRASRAGRASHTGWAFLALLRERVLPVVLGLAAIGIIWEGAIWFFDVKPFVLPSLTAIFGATIDDLPRMLVALQATLYEAGSGYALGTAIGVALAMLMVFMPPLERVLMPVVVAINHFTTDTDAEVAAVQDYVSRHGADAILCRHWAEGSAGITELAERVVELADGGQADFKPLYPDAMPLMEKIETVASKIYHAGEVTADKAVRDQLAAWEAQGYRELPVCIAKTQYSFSTDPTLRGAPEGHVVHVREVRLSAGAGFVVAITGEIMTMPGLPSSPSAERIFLNDDGHIEGLF